MRSALVPCVLVLACTTPKPIVYPPLALERPGQQQQEGGTGGGGSGESGGGGGAPAAPRRHDFAIDKLAMGLALLNDTLVWTDIAGAVWMMPANGSAEARQVSEQHRDGFATHPFVAGTQMLAHGKNVLLDIAVPKGSITQNKITGTTGNLLNAVSDGTSVFTAQFNTDHIVRVPIHGGAVKQVVDVPKAVLAVHAGALYAASYTTGEVVVVADGGKPRVLAKGLSAPTAIAVDDTAAFVYTKGDRSVVRIELASGATSVIATQLENSDELVLAGDAIYTVSWPHDLVRLAKVAGRPPVHIADDLYQPRGIVTDGHAIYVTCDGPPRIVSIPL